MEEKTENIEHTESHEHKKLKKRYLAIGLGILVAIGVGYFIHETLMFQSTDDAYVETTTVQVAPRVAGQITDVYITDNQRVHEGDLVAKIDDADYIVKVEQAKARYERALLNQTNAKANLTAANTNIEVAHLIRRRLNMMRLRRNRQLLNRHCFQKKELKLPMLT